MVGAVARILGAVVDVVFSFIRFNVILNES